MFKNIGSKLKSIIILAFWASTIIYALIGLMVVLYYKNFVAEPAGLYGMYFFFLVVVFVVNYIVTLFSLAVAQITENTDNLLNELPEKLDDITNEVKIIKAIIAPLAVDNSINDSMLGKNKPQMEYGDESVYRAVNTEEQVNARYYEKTSSDPFEKVKDKEFFNFLNEEFESNSSTQESDDSEPLQPWLSEDFFDGKQ